jgi:putative ABC transport system permease protein
MYAWRVLTAHPVRLLLTLSGIALCVVLILFILGIYHGIKVGSLEYIRQTEGDIWVLQANTTNIMRGTSILLEGYREEICEDARIDSAASVLMFLTSIDCAKSSASVLLTGYRPGALGAPPRIVAGRELRADDEIVLDEAFAAKHGVSVDARVSIRGDSLTVVGLSSGTNLSVMQYAFVTLAYEQSLVDFPGLASYFVLQVRSRADIPAVISDVEERFPGQFAVYTKQEFLDNNLREVDAGVLPLFYAIALIGAVVLAIILSLILSVSILERRSDFAVMKIIGSPVRYLRRLVVGQSLLIGGVAEILGLLLLYPVLALIKLVTPEVAATITTMHVIGITLAVLGISVASGLLASRRVRQIAPSEVFA